MPATSPEVSAPLTMSVSQIATSAHAAHLGPIGPLGMTASNPALPLQAVMQPRPAPSLLRLHADGPTDARDRPRPTCAAAGDCCFHVAKPTPLAAAFA